LEMNIRHSIKQRGTLCKHPHLDWAFKMFRSMIAIMFWMSVAAFGSSDGRAEERTLSNKFTVMPSDRPFHLGRAIEGDFKKTRYRCSLNHDQDCGWDELATKLRICAFLVIKNGLIKFEHYSGQSGAGANVQCEPDEGGPNSISRPYAIASITKSIMSSALGIAIAEQTGATPAHLHSYLRSSIGELTPGLTGTAFDRVSLDRLLRMRSGIGWREDDDRFLGIRFPGDGDRMSLMVTNKDQRSMTFREFARTIPFRFPIESAPFQYASVNSAVAGLVLESLISDRSTNREFLYSRLWRRVGANFPIEFKQDSLGHLAGSCCTQSSVHDLALFGEMIMQNGRNRSGESVVPEQWIRLATRRVPGQDDSTKMGSKGDRGCVQTDYRYKWWLAAAPRTDFTAIGRSGQFVHIYPDRQTVIVQIAQWHDTQFDSGDDPFCISWRAHDRIVDALN
jgi:CubicO group peptidase (beta-lactamase class C family)